jgi:hypothetical protein
MASTENQKLAEKLLKILESGTNNQPDLATLFASIEKINHRLDKLETVQQNSQRYQTSTLSDHPSTEKFSIEEAIADAVFDAKSKEKACTFEPNGKPCDHCSMCSARGF